MNNDTLTIREGDALLQGGSLTGNGSVEKSGSGTLTVSNTTLTQKAVNLNEGTLTLNDSTRCNRSRRSIPADSSGTSDLYSGP